MGDMLPGVTHLIERLDACLYKMSHKKQQKYSTAQMLDCCVNTLAVKAKQVFLWLEATDCI